ncbi:hypothetical protein CANCADRAFT_123437 [Tortispora caseinolytica NRRL Y-17796]|uniref:Uncharacterized protein n=1 Tax=Tortispora caseinolytica NRRL Y-17796 TaxID=767744 RepID=A0A1E4TI15_9ASCO|nr:hypothetical protein CANCADRAFT_123437 [Tortispora caseinolytica NRRL Y-17796]
MADETKTIIATYVNGDEKRTLEAVSTSIFEGVEALQENVNEFLTVRIETLEDETPSDEEEEVQL